MVAAGFFAAWSMGLTPRAPARGKPGEAVRRKAVAAFDAIIGEGLSLDDAAALVGANTPAVKQRVLHARRELLTLIDRDDRLTRRFR